MKLKNNLLILLSTIALALPIASYADAASECPKLKLSAQATICKPSDELQLTIGVVNYGDTAEITLAENSSRMQSVIASLEAAGLTDDEYETGQFSIQPTYTPYPKEPPINWKPSINGYEVNNSIIIHTEKLDMAGKFIDVANKAGANSISDIRFGLHNPRDYWSEALGAAAANAISDAQAIASAARVNLVRILSITLDNTNVVSPQVNAAYLAKAMISDSAPPIEPGEVSITANVTLVYEISSN
jgi:uncharacterized protein